MVPELDWGAEDGLAYQDMGAIYAQIGWDTGARSGAVEAAAAGSVGGRGAGAGAGAGMHRVIHHNHGGGGGGGGGGRDGGEGWFTRGATQDQMHVWGVQPAPGLARQYATTRHGERGGALVSFVSSSGGRGGGGVYERFYRSSRHIYMCLIIWCLFPLLSLSLPCFVFGLVKKTMCHNSVMWAELENITSCNSYLAPFHHEAR